MEHLGYTYPSVVARSCLSSMLLKPKSLLGRAPWPHVVKEAVWLSPGDLEGVEAVDGLIEHATEVLEFTMRSLCASPGRLRRKLRHLIDHWAGLCNVAEDLDMSDVMVQFISARGVQWAGGWWGARVWSSWVQNYLCRLQILHLALGFKLGLYAEREFLMIYWYIEYVQTSLLDNLTQAAKSLADGFAADHAAATAAAAVDDAKPQKASPLGKKKGKGKGEQGTAGPGAGADVKAAVVPWSPAQQQLALEIAEVEAQQSMCRGYVRMLAGLSVQGLLKLAGGPTDAAASHALPQFNTLAQVRSTPPHCSRSCCRLLRGVPPLSRSLPNTPASRAAWYLMARLGSGVGIGPVSVSESKRIMWVSNPNAGVRATVRHDAHLAVPGGAALPGLYHQHGHVQIQSAAVIYCASQLARAGLSNRTAKPPVNLPVATPPEEATGRAFSPARDPRGALHVGR
jgi:hypothetical protein